MFVIKVSRDWCSDFGILALIFGVEGLYNSRLIRYVQGQGTRAGDKANRFGRHFWANQRLFWANQWGRSACQGIEIDLKMRKTHSRKVGTR
jgi:hypothetical protein